MTDGLRELVERLEKEAQDVEEGDSSPIHRTEYASGVCAGIRYAKDELKEALDENEEANDRTITEPYASRKGNGYGVDND